jgi:4-hydroxybenzoate polyprenyltransferase
VCALDWFLVNLLNRVVDLKEDRANAITGTGFVERHRRAILVGGFATLAGSLAALHVVMPAITPLRTASAMGFMLTVFGYPLAATGWGASFPAGITWTAVALAALFFFAFELSYEVIYDLRDAPGDAQAGVRTYPVVHGTHGAMWIIDVLVATSIAALIGGYAAGAIPWRLVVMVAGPVLQLLVYKRAVRRGITSSDCIFITWLGAGLLVAYHLWVIAGLPGVA